MEISVLEKKLGAKFKNEDLLTEALTHRSYLNEYPKWRLPHNERLEYLGDAVLELLVTEELFSKFPKQAEGQLTVLLAALVNFQILARVAEHVLQARGRHHPAEQGLGGRRVRASSRNVVQPSRR